MGGNRYSRIERARRTLRMIVSVCTTLIAAVEHRGLHAVTSEAYS